MKKVGIIGAGLGGLTAGALLSQKGYDVNVFEKEKVVGGRSLTLEGDELTLEDYKKILHRFDIWMPHSEPSLEEIFERNLLEGYRLDLGFHLLGFIDKSPLTKILNDEGVTPPYSASRFGVISPEKEVMHDFKEYLSIWDKLQLMPLLFRFALLRRSTISDMDKVPVEETLDKYCKDWIRDALETAARYISTVNDLEKISTAEILGVMKQWGGNAKPTGYPKGGSIAVCKGLAEIIKKNGGKVHLEKKVDEISIKNGEAKGVMVGGEKKEQDIVISNLPVQDVFEIAPKKHFPEDYVEKLINLEGSGSVCAYYALEDLDESILKKPIAFRERDLGVEGKDAAGIIDLQTAKPEMDMSPNGEYLIQAYIICTPEEAKDKDKVKTLRKALDKNMELVLPNYKDALLFESVYSLNGADPSTLVPIE